MWCNHPSFKDLVQKIFGNGNELLNSISTFQKQAHTWNKNVFGNIFQELRKTLARIEGLQKYDRLNHCGSLQNLEKELTKKYDEFLQLEKELRMTKSRITWLSEGDANTTFFYTAIY